MGATLGRRRFQATGGPGAPVHPAAGLQGYHYDAQSRARAASRRVSACRAEPPADRRQRRAADSKFRPAATRTQAGQGARRRRGEGNGMRPGVCIREPGAVLERYAAASSHGTRTRLSSHRLTSSLNNTELDDLIRVPPDASLEELDYALRNYIAFASRFMGQSSPTSSPFPHLRSYTPHTRRRRVSLGAGCTRARTADAPRCSAIHGAPGPHDRQCRRLHRRPFRLVRHPLHLPHARSLPQGQHQSPHRHDAGVVLVRSRHRQRRPAQKGQEQNKRRDHGRQLQDLSPHAPEVERGRARLDEMGLGRRGRRGRPDSAGPGPASRRRGPRQAPGHAGRGVGRARWDHGDGGAVRDVSRAEARPRRAR